MTVVEQKEKKDYSFLTNIFDLCVECLDMGVVPNPEVCDSLLIVQLGSQWKTIFSILLMTILSGGESTVLIRFV